MMQVMSEVVFVAPVPVAAGSMERRMVQGRAASAGTPKVERMTYDTDTQLLTITVAGALPRLYPACAIAMMVPAQPAEEPKHQRR